MKNCNVCQLRKALGLLKDDPNITARAAEYLMVHKKENRYVDQGI